MAKAEFNSDAWLDAQLRDVPLPDGLLDRLGRVAALTAEELDAALRDVPLPEGFLLRLRRTVESRLRLLRLRQYATAISLMLAIGIWYYAFLVSVVSSSHGFRAGIPGGRALVQLRGDFSEVLQPAGEAPEVAVAPWPPEAVTPDDAFAVEASRPPVPFPSQGQAPRSAMGLGATTVLGLPPPESDLDATLARWPVVTSPLGVDPPDLWPVPLPSPRGVDPPIVQGFDLAFLRQHGVHPFVMPAAHPALAMSQAPLAVDTSSFELARKYLESGMLPPRDAVRTEEFLAAMDFGYPQPRRGQQIALTLGGGPSVFRGGDFKMLQVGLQAELVRDRDRPGARLTMALDVSSSMDWGARLDMAVRAFEQLKDRLGRQDRVSVVLFDSRAHTLAEDLAREDLDQLIEVLRGIRPSGSTNAAEGLRHAYALARRYAGVDRRASRVVLLTDGLVQLDPDTGSRIEQLLAEAAAEGIPLDALDMGQERPDDHPDAQLVRLAQAGGGRAYRVTNSDQVRWAILEAATGQPQLVAADVRLRVTFNPTAVLSYRLLGHEAKAIVGLKPPRVEADFRSGQWATVLYELRLRPGEANDVAVAELTWSDPNTGEARSLQRRFLRKDFSPTLDQAPLALQAALVAAQAAEVLRDSPFAGFAPWAGSHGAVVEASRKLDSRVQAWPSLRAMVALMERASTARPYRAGGRR